MGLESCDLNLEDFDDEISDNETIDDEILDDLLGISIGPGIVEELFIAGGAGLAGYGIYVGSPVIIGVGAAIVVGGVSSKILSIKKVGKSIQKLKRNVRSLTEDRNKEIKELLEQLEE